MAEIPRAAVDYLTQEVNGISADAKAKVLRVLEKLDWQDVGACRAAVVEAVNAVLEQHALAAATAAADFYDVSRAAATGEALGAVAHVSRRPEATESAIRAFAQKIADGKPRETFDSLVMERIDYEIKRAAGECTAHNASIDPMKPKYARVPSGAETCRFCLMLASRGFVYASKANAGGVDHWHGGCDCRVVCSFGGCGVEGYDPDALYSEWDALMHADARERAERNGTDEADEYAAAIARLEAGAKRAKQRGKQ